MFFCPMSTTFFPADTRGRLNGLNPRDKEILLDRGLENCYQVLIIRIWYYSKLEGNAWNCYHGKNIGRGHETG